MRFRSFLFFFTLLSMMFFNSLSALACDTCGCAFNSDNSNGLTSPTTVITPTAGTLGKGRGFLGFLADYAAYDEIPAVHGNKLTDAGHDIHDKRHEGFYVLAGGYGLTKNFDLSLSLPYVSCSSVQVEDVDNLGRGEHASAVGDLKLAGKYRFWSRGVSAALLFGVKVPTGKDSAKDKSGDKFGPELQPGSGSWDYNAGAAVSRGFGEHAALASAVQYTYRGEGAQEERLGGVFRHDLGISYAIKPLGQHPNVSFLLEVETQWLGKDRSRKNDKVLDSGGTAVFIGPGLSATLNQSVSAFVEVPIPVYQNPGGEHQKTRYEIISGVSRHF